MAPTIPGPFGHFWVPFSADHRTLENGITTTQEVWAGEYEHPELPPQVSTVLDIGAGWGAFAVWARTRWPDATVIGYEPHAAAAAIHRQNMPGAALFESAVTVDAAPLFYVDQYWSGGHTHQRAEGVPVSSVHPATLPSADILKCDAEGVEAEVLEHYAHLPTLRALLYEFHTPELRDECRAILARRAPWLRCLREERDRGYGVSLWVPQ